MIVVVNRLFTVAHDALPPGEGVDTAGQARMHDLLEGTPREFTFPDQNPPRIGGPVDRESEWKQRLEESIASLCTEFGVARSDVFPDAEGGAITPWGP